MSVIAGPALAEEPASDGVPQTDHWRLTVSPYTEHFRYSPEHKPVWAVGGEKQKADGSLTGLAYFRNSFGQPSGYAYVGQRYFNLLDDAPEVFFQWSAGLMYGYKGKYKNKVPLNVDGFSPAALVTAGWQINPRASAEVHLLGDAGVMLQLSYEFR